MAQFRKRFLFLFVMLTVAVSVAACYPFAGSADRPETTQVHVVTSNTLPLSLKWQVNTDDPIRFRPYVLDGMVLVKTAEAGCTRCRDGKAKLIAFDAASGTKLWESHFKGLFENTPPILFDDAVVFPINADDSLRAVNKRTGETLWETKAVRPSSSIDALIHNDQYIFAASGVDPITVYAVAPLTGEIVWQESEGVPTRSRRVLALENGELLAFFREEILVFKPKTGALVRRYPVALPSFNFPSYHNGFLFINPENGIWAIRADSGELLWKFEPACIRDLKQNEGPVRSFAFFQFSPVILDETVYANGGCRQVFALDLGVGAVKWAYDSGNLPSLSPLEPMDGIGYVPFSDGSLRAIDLVTGNELGRAEISPKPLQGFPEMQGLNTADGMLFAAFGGRTLFAFSK